MKGGSSAMPEITSSVSSGYRSGGGKRFFYYPK